LKEDILFIGLHEDLVGVLTPEAEGENKVLDWSKTVVSALFQ
jgi:hypothetical protein